MRTCKMARGNARLMEETLSDSSIVYDVVIGNVSFHAKDYEDARWLWEYLSRVSKTVYED